MHTFIAAKATATTTIKRNDTHDYQRYEHVGWVSFPRDAFSAHLVSAQIPGRLRRDAAVERACSTVTPRPAGEESSSQLPSFKQQGSVRSATHHCDISHPRSRYDCGSITARDFFTAVSHCLTERH